VGTGFAAALGRAARRAHDRGARKRQQGTPGPAERCITPGNVRVSRCDRSTRCKKEEYSHLKMAVPLLRRERSFDATAFCARPEGARIGRGHRAPTGFAACIAPRFRKPPAPQRRRFADRADAARPYRHLDDTDLHPCGRRAAQKPGARPAPACGKVTILVCCSAAARETPCLDSPPNPRKTASHRNHRRHTKPLRKRAKPLNTRAFPSSPETASPPSPLFPILP